MRLTESAARTALADPRTLPPFSALSPELMGTVLDELIAVHRRTIDAVLQSDAKDFASAWLPLERAEAAIHTFWSASAHLHAVADTPDIRAAYAAGEARLTEHFMEVRQNRGLYDRLIEISAAPDFASLPAADRVAVEHALRDFRLAGVALEPNARERFARISVELSALATEFSSAVQDATDAWSEHVTDEGLLAGLSPSDKAMFARAARDRNLEGWVVTLQAPSVNAVMTFAEDRGLRERVYRASGTRASDQGPNGGQFDNSDRIARILELRREAAILLGFSNPVEWSLETKMASSPGEVLAFLRDLARRARPSAERDLAELREFARTELGIEALEAWDTAFASNRLREARFALDEQAVRAYFPLERVMGGWEELLASLFGIRVEPRDDVDLWHQDARYYDVREEDGRVLGGLYVDLHARTGKRGGAWMAPARPRLGDGSTVSRPVAFLTCNFAPNTPGTPSLLSHYDVATLLHETGHALHHLFTLVDRPSIAGTSGFEWDAVELPSQLMEDFAWDRSILSDMSGHYLTGERLPLDMFEKLLAARHFQAGPLVLRQIEFALFDLLLHLGTLGSDPMEVIETVRDEVAVIRPPSWHRFPHGFTHIFAGAYASGYYSYLWAEVLAADGFARFSERGLRDRPTGDAFREEILSRGATRPAAESFRAFRGRDADVRALLERRGLAA